MGSGEALATNYTWVPTLCLFGGCNWTPSGFWTPSGSPGAGDFATINSNANIRLDAHIGSLAGLTMSNGARVRTNGFSLSASSSGANTFLYGYGPGSAGSSTRLQVDSGAAFGFDFVGFFYSMHQGAELRMNGGGFIATFGINVSQTSLISGHGTVALLSNGTRFDVAGTVRPNGGDLLLWSQAASRLDLDGNVGQTEFGHLDVTSSGNLEIRGALTDPFSGLMEIGSSNEIEFDTAVVIDGQVHFVSGTNNHLIAPDIDFLTGAEVLVDGAIGYIDPPTEWFQDATIELVASTDELHLLEDSFFDASTTWIGGGLLVNEFAGTMTLEDGSDVAVGLLNDGQLIIDDAIGFVVLNDFDLGSPGMLSLDIEGTVPGVGFDSVHVTGDLFLAGDLELNVDSSFPLSQGHAFEVLTIDGTSTGAFNGLPEDGLVDVWNGEELFITYQGGDGNDVVLYTLPEPGMALGLGIGAAALAFSGRRREG